MKKYLIMLTALVMMLALTVGATAETYTEWTNATSLPTSGTYKLMTDVTLSSKVAISSTLTLDLNGHTVTCNNGSHLHVQQKGKLFINDTVGSGKITAGTSWSASWLIYVQGTIEINGGTFEHTYDSSKPVLYLQNDNPGNNASGTMNGGIIRTTSTKAGTPISVGKKADFVMNGGTVESKTKGNPNERPAISLSNDASSVTINGGTIIAEGSGIQANAGAVTITGGSITANYGLYTRNAVVDPAPGSTVTITAQTAAVRAYNEGTTGTGNQILGGTISAPTLIVSAVGQNNGEENLTVAGGTFKDGAEGGVQGHLVTNGYIDPNTGRVFVPTVAPAVSYSVPQTGDNTPIALLMCMLLLAGAGMLALKRRSA